MSVIILPHRWRQQPQGPLVLDRANRLTQGLIFGYDSRMGDFVGGKALTTVGSPGVAVASGVAADYTAVNTYRKIVSIPADLRPTQVTVFWFGRMFDTSDADILQNPPLLAAYYDSGGNSPYFAYGVFRRAITGDHTHIAFGWNAAGTGYLPDYANAITYGADASYALTVSATSARHFKNGKLLGTGAGGTITYGASVPTLFIGGGHPTDTTQNCHDYFTLGAVWNRPLSDAEIASLSENPWQIFTPLQRRIWVGATVGNIGSATGTSAASGVSGSTATASGTESDNVISGFTASASGTSTASATSGGNYGTASGTSTSSGISGSIATADGTSSTSGVAVPTSSSTGSGGGRYFGAVYSEQTPVRTIKKKILKKVEQRKKIQQKLTEPLGSEELEKVLAQVQRMQDQIDRMVDSYTQAITTVRVQVRQDQEDLDELMDLTLYL